MAHNNSRLLIGKAFSYFDQKGTCYFPSPDLIRNNARQGVVTALVLDANVCLNLANYTLGQKDGDMEATVRTFLLAIELVKVDVVPFFGCLELVSSRCTDQLDREKLSSLTSNIARALAQSEASLARGERVAIRAEDDLKLTDKSLSAIYPMLRYAYCCFLKIFEIRARGHLKGRAVKHFIEFFDWCESMKCHIGLISQSAFALFGGAKDADRLLSLRDGKTPLDAAWGAAWDIWHCWMTQNYLPTLPIDGLPQHSIFVTDDGAAAFIAGQCLPHTVILNNSQPILSASMLSSNFPYYDAEKHDRLTKLLRSRDSIRHARMLEEIMTQSKFDHASVESEIEHLEKLIMDTWLSDSRQSSSI